MPHIQKRLAKLGVQTWQLARPQVLKGEVAISIPSAIKLIIVVEDSIDLHEPFINDLMRSVDSHHTEVLVIRLEQLALLGAALSKNPNLNPRVWLMTDLIETLSEHYQSNDALFDALLLKSVISAPKVNQQVDDQAEEYIELITVFIKEFSARTIIVPSISSLKQHSDTKRLFWKRMQIERV